jgi:hypothetical protein
VLDLAGADAEGQRAERAVVEVWLSPQTMVMPGWVSPSCGPITCTMPWSRSPIGASRMPNSAALCRSASTCARLTGSAIGLRIVERRDVVVLGGEREVGAAHRRPGSASPSKACGLVTSCTRCRSM